MDRFRLKEEFDIVDKPKHYNSFEVEVFCPECQEEVVVKLEVIDIIEAITKDIKDGRLSYLLGTVLKYVCRAQHKNGPQDYKKAKWFLDRIVGRYGEKDAHSKQKVETS